MRKFHAYLFISGIIVLFLISGTMGFAAEKSYVEVKLRSGATIKFSYDSFTFDWIMPKRIIHQLSCEETEIKDEEIDEIHIGSEFSNNCQDKEDWNVIIYDKEKHTQMGFLSVSKYEVKGIDLETGQERVLHFKDIKKIKYRK